MLTKKLLVLRFSAMGDVAMTVPVIRELLDQNPKTEIVIVSRQAFKPFFEQIPQITFHAIEPKGKHQGLFGLLRLFNELRKYHILAVADLHENLRSRAITSLFRFSGIKTAVIDKGRPEKKALTRKLNKKLVQLKPSTERYADVFRDLGLGLKLKNQLVRNPEVLSEKVVQIVENKGTHKWIGISPFAQHSQKVYPLDKMEKVVQALAQAGHQLFIFGGGKVEQEIAEAWEGKYQNALSLIGKLTLSEELNLISNLDVMLSMDSAGMHLASLKGIPVVSVWGATHPYAGFLGYGQSLGNCVQLDLSCRPCSVYGNKPCHRSDFACMNKLEEKIIIQKVLDTIH